MSRATALLIQYRKWRAKRLHSGERAPMSGQYRRSDGKEITISRGEVMPPTPRSGMTFSLIDASNVDEAQA